MKSPSVCLAGWLLATGCLAAHGQGVASFEADVLFDYRARRPTLTGAISARMS